MLQIVTELDGFDPRGNIKVLMATNRPDTLDAALVCLIIITIYFFFECVPFGACYFVLQALIFLIFDFHHFTAIFFYYNILG